MLKENNVGNQGIRNGDTIQLPNINDEEDSRLSNQNKRQSSMIDFSHDQKGHKGGQARRYGTSKRRQAKQEKAEVCTLFKELITIINTRYLTAQTFDSKSNNQPEMYPKKSAQAPKKLKQQQEKLTNKLRAEKETKIKEKVNSIMAMDKKEAIKQQQDQLKGEVFNNYHLVMEYEIGEQSQMQQIELNANGNVRNQPSNSDTANNFNPCIPENPQKSNIVLGGNKAEVPPKQSINKIKAINRQKLSYHLLESITINPQFNNEGQQEVQGQGEDKKRQAGDNIENENEENIENENEENMHEMNIQNFDGQDLSENEDIRQQEGIQIQNENINDINEQQPPQNSSLSPINDHSPSPLNNPELPKPQDKEQNDPQVQNQQK